MSSVFIFEREGRGYGYPTNIKLTGCVFGNSYDSNTRQIDRDGTAFLCNVWEDNGELIPG